MGRADMPFLLKPEDKDASGKFDYVGNKGKWFSGPSLLANGEQRQVSVCHTTLEDHLKAIGNAGLALTRLEEPVVTEEVGSKHPSFAKIVGATPFIILQGVKR
jgi:hypothetical protein